MTETRERIEETAHDVGASVRDGSPVAKTVATAVVAAAFAGLASAAKTMIERRRSADDEHAERPEAEADDHEPEAEADDAEPEAGSDDEPEAEAGDQEPEAEADEPEPEADTDDQEPEAESDETAASAEPDAGAEDADEEEDEPTAEAEADEDGSRPGGGTAEVVDAARRELEALLGHEVESVSSFERCDDGWRVTLEVVDLRRVPDSSDVLSSYEVVIDDDRRLVSLDRSRRYRRAQVDPE
jgi:hypothetical protein